MGGRGQRAVGVRSPILGPGYHQLTPGVCCCQLQGTHQWWEGLVPKATVLALSISVSFRGTMFHKTS